MGNGLIAVKKRHIAHVDLPVMVARSARIGGVIRRTALGQGAGGGEEKDEDNSRNSQHCYGTQVRPPNECAKIKTNSAGLNVKDDVPELFIPQAFAEQERLAAIDAAGTPCSDEGE